MAIQFPLTMPAAPGFTRFDLQWPTLVGRTGGGLAAAEQVQEWDDGPMRFVAELPPFSEGGAAPYDRATLGQWEAFLLALRGGAGTFLMGDPRHAALLGIGPAAGEFPTVDGDQVAGSKTVATRGWGANRSGALKRGDVWQLAKNYLLSPKAFDSADWTKIGAGVAAPAVTPDAVDNPDPGTVNDADQIDFPATGAAQTSSIYQAGSSVPQIAGRTFQASVWLRTVSGSFNLKVYVGNQSGVVRTSTLAALTTGWSRVFFTATMIAGDTTMTLVLEQTENESAKSVYAWGAMLYSTEQDARLHKGVGTADLSADGNGDIAIDAVPRLRVAVPDFSPLILTNARGTWRLAKSSIERAMDRRKLSALGFEGVEAINLV